MLPALAWCWLAAASLVGLVAAVADKRRARRGKGRVPEAAFHALALLGGWPGALLGFLAVRHKTSKPRFLAPFLLCALANAIVLVWAWQAGIRLPDLPG
ncbi:MAG: DUF1294 domain-containing protein [Thermoplasmatota archaeon]